jgi:hypothetical protein
VKGNYGVFLGILGIAGDTIPVISLRMGSLETRRIAEDAGLEPEMPDPLYSSFAFFRAAMISSAIA